MKKPLSKTLEEEGIAFSFPIEIKNAAGKETYHETSDGDWWKFEYNAAGQAAYYENSNGYWRKTSYNAAGQATYFENSNGEQIGTPKAKHEGKVVTVDGTDYELKEITEDEKTTK